MTTTHESLEERQGGRDQGQTLGRFMKYPSHLGQRLRPEVGTLTVPTRQDTLSPAMRPDNHGHAA